MTYYLFHQGEVSGPYTNDQVVSLCQSGSVSHGTQIREEGAVEWKPLHSVFPTFSGRSPIAGGAQGGVLITGVHIPFWDMVSILFRFVLAAFFVSACAGVVAWVVVAAVRVIFKT